MTLGKNRKKKDLEKIREDKRKYSRKRRLQIREQQYRERFPSGRFCLNCGFPIPKEVTLKTRYCSDICRLVHQYLEKTRYGRLGTLWKRKMRIERTLRKLEARRSLLPKQISRIKNLKKKLEEIEEAIPHVV